MDPANRALLDRCLNKDLTLTETPDPPPNAIAVFNRGYSCFIVDDGCYVICNWARGNWVQSTHIFEEAVMILNLLPENPRDV